MDYLIFDKLQTTYKIAILIKQNAFKIQGIHKNYIKPMLGHGVEEKDVIAYSLAYNNKDKAPIKLINPTLQNILKACKFQNIKTLLVADSNYFKKLIGATKAEPHYGYIKKCAIKDYEDIDVILTVNYKALFFNPLNQEKINLSIKTLLNHLSGTHIDLGTGIIHTAVYPETEAGIIEFLKFLLTREVLTCDIESYGLELAPLGTIAFAWNEHEGGAFQLQPDHTTKYYSSRIHNILREFFLQYKGTLIFHNASFDIKQLIFSLFMQGNYNDYIGVIDGLKTFFPKIHDTKVITYLSVNSTARNNLGLKYNALEFAGNYAHEDIADISQIPFKELKEYNLVDALATWYVYNKNFPKMCNDGQLRIYHQIMIPSLKVITNMELVGLPININTANDAAMQLSLIIGNEHVFIIQQDAVKQWEWHRQLENYISNNAKLKTKINPFDNFKEQFNSGSDKHLQELLHDQIGLDIIDKTDGGAPSTGVKTLKKHINKLMNEYNITEKELI